MINPKEKTKQSKPATGPKHTFVISATRECLQVDKNRINFCKYPIFASHHKHILINIELQDFFTEPQRKDFHLLSIKTQTNLKGHQDVFTFKLVDGGDEVSQMQVPIKQHEPMQINIKATIPELQVSTDINGTLTLQVDEFAPLTIPISSRGEVPSIICLKEMVNEKTGFKIIKIPSKNVMKIPFKNCSNINFFFEIKLLGSSQITESDGVKLKIIHSQPMPPPKFDDEKKKENIIMKVDANSTFCITIQFELLKKDGSIRIARRLLILQVQGTKLFFTFPLEVIISE